MAKDKYSLVEDNLITIEGWVRDGATNEEIAKRLGIGKTTFYKYIAEHSELSELLKKGKGIVDTQVENALLKRAMGYKYEETTQELRDGEMVVTKVVVKEVAPDTTAQIFWLKNRRPEAWRDKQETSHTFPQGDFTIEVKGSDEDNP